MCIRDRCCGSALCAPDLALALEGRMFTLGGGAGRVRCGCPHMSNTCVNFAGWMHISDMAGDWGLLQSRVGDGPLAPLRVVLPWCRAATLCQHVQRKGFACLVVWCCSLVHNVCALEDRAMGERISKLGEQSVRGEILPDNAGSVLSVYMDGMDVAKFRCPRQTSLAKQFASLWRPQLHCMGGIIDGIADVFFISDLYVPKNGDTQATLLARLLEMTMDYLVAKGVPTPAGLRVHSDNA
eukprot:15439576-Alexandrium_andersonii.AAC.1